jgi:prevent-host-death family protein
MDSTSATKARASLYKLIDDVGESARPVLITGKRKNAVLVSEESWNAIQETLFLVSIPGMRDSIREGLATPVEDCSDELEW